MVNNSYKAYFKSNSRDTNSVMFVNNGYSFTMNIATSQVTWYSSALNAIIGMQQPMNPQNTVAAITNEVITYSGAWINTDLQYQVYGDSLKETLIIHAVSPPTSPIYADYLQYAANCYYDSSLTIYANGVGYLHPTNQRFTTTGSICFNDNQNATVFSVPPPTIHDSSGSYITGVYGVTANNGIIIINIRFPKVFLDSAVYPVYLDPSLYEYYNVNQDDYDYFYDDIWDAQTFAVGATGHTITSVKLMMFRVGSPGILTVHIRNSSDGAKPNGADLTTGTYNANDLGTSSVGAWIEVTVSEITLDASTSYAICCSCTGADINNRVCWKADSSSPSYGDGEYSQSDDAGTNWYPTTDYDMMFEVYGNSLGSIPYEDYIDNDTSDVDSTADVGTSSAFANQKATDSTYDTLTEAQVFDGYVTDYVDNDSSDVDSSADKGSSSAFNNQKATDSTYDTLTEADDDAGTSQWGDTSGSGGSYRTTAADEVRLYSYTATSTGEVASIVFYGRGVSATNAKAIITDSSGNLLTNGVGTATAVSTSAGTKTLTYAAGSRPLVTSGTTYWIGFISQAAIRLYYDSTTGSTSKQDTTNSYASPTSPTDAGSTTETWRLMYANINNINYRLDLEVQFTSVDTTKTVSTVCVKTGTLNGESLLFKVRSGGAWVSLGTLSASAWNNYTVTGYVSATMTFQFIDGTVTNDVSQSSWQIDSVLLYQHNENYRLSYEEQFEDVEYSRNTEYLCIKTGTYSNGETIKVSYWTGAAWSVLSASLTASAWNNISVSLTSSDYYILFEGGTETGGDAVQSTWQLDAVLLKTWWQYTPTLAVSSTYSAAKSLIMLKTASQSLTFTKSAGKLAEWIKSVSQALSYSSVASKIREVTKTVSQALSLSSASTRLFESLRSAAKSISFTGAAARAGEWIRSAAQTLSYSSTVSRIKEVFASLTQSLSLSPSSSKLLDLIKSVTQSVSLSSLASRGSEILKSASQSLAAVTGAGRLYEATRNAAQSLTLSGITSRITELTRSVAQIITSAFSASKASEYLRSVGQSIASAFNVTRFLESLRDAGQNVTVSGLSARLFEANRDVSQTITPVFSAIAEFMAASVEYFRDVSQSLGLTSGVGRLIEIAKSVSQSLNFGVLGYKIQEFIASTSLGIILLIHVTNFEPAFGGIPPMFVILVGFMVILVLIVRRR